MALLIFDRTMAQSICSQFLRFFVCVMDVPSAVLRQSLSILWAKLKKLLIVKKRNFDDFSKNQHEPDVSGGYVLCAASFVSVVAKSHLTSFQSCARTKLGTKFWFRAFCLSSISVMTLVAGIFKNLHHFASLRSAGSM